MSTQYENDLLMVDRRWRYDADGCLWIFPRNKRTITAKSVKKLELVQLHKIVFLVERGFVYTGKKWIRGSVSVEACEFEAPLQDFKRTVRRKQNDDRGKKWTPRIPPG